MNRFGSRFWLIWSGIFGASGVALGAFGAHALKPVLPLQMMTVFETAVKYHLLHTLALLGCGILMEVFPAREARIRIPAGLFFAGILLFSGSLYGISMSDFRFLGIITPLGGVTWIVAWAWLATAFWGE